MGLQTHVRSRSQPASPSCAAGFCLRTRRKIGPDEELRSLRVRHAHLKIRYAAPPGPQKLKPLVNHTSLQVPDLDPKEYEKYLAFPAAADWAELGCGIVSLYEDDNSLNLYTGRPSVDIAIDRFQLEPVCCPRRPAGAMHWAAVARAQSCATGLPRRPDSTLSGNPHALRRPPAPARPRHP